MLFAKIGAIDAETDGLGGKLLCFSTALEGGETKVFLGPSSNRRVVKELDQDGVIWCAHNLSGYDLKYLIQELFDLEAVGKLKIDFGLRSDSMIHRVTLQFTESGNVAYLFDTLAIFAGSLDAFTKSYCPELPKLDIGLKNGVKWNARNPDHIEYVKRDVESLVLAMRRFNDAFYVAWGVYPRWTAASSAFEAWKITLPVGTVYQGTSQYESFIRRGYYGGYVAAFDTNPYSNCTTYDINSSYPAAMRSNVFPTGTARKVKTRNHKLLGIYAIRVTVPQSCRHPVIATKMKSGKQGALTVWPGCGSVFTTVADSCTIDYAVRERGYKIDIIDGVEWDETCSPFKDFVDKGEELKQTATDPGIRNAAKLALNSTYGKFGARRDRLRIVGIESREVREARSHTPLELTDRYVAIKEQASEMEIIPEWAVFITAYARIALFKWMDKAGLDNVLYCDTDSVTLKAGIELPTGNKFGDMKLEKSWTTFRAAGLKSYAGELEGEWHGASKGVPKSQQTETLFRNTFKGKRTVVEYLQGSNSVAYLKQGGPIEFQKATRTTSDVRSSRWWRLDDQTGLVYPFVYHEQMDLFEDADNV